MMTVRDVSERTKTPAGTIHDWVDCGFIVPAERNGVGAGNGHRFSVSQVAALHLAANLRRLGAGRSMVKEVLAVLGAMGDERMKVAIEDGVRVYLPGMGFTQPPSGIEVPRNIDLAELYRIATEACAHLETVRARSAKTT